MVLLCGIVVVLGVLAFVPVLLVIAYVLLLLLTAAAAVTVLAGLIRVVRSVMPDVMRRVEARLGTLIDGEDVELARVVRTMSELRDLSASSWRRQLQHVEMGTPVAKASADLPQSAEERNRVQTWIGDHPFRFSFALVTATVTFTASAPQTLDLLVRTVAEAKRVPGQMRRDPADDQGPEGGARRHDSTEKLVAQVRQQLREGSVEDIHLMTAEIREMDLRDDVTRLLADEFADPEVVARLGRTSVLLGMSIAETDKLVGAYEQGRNPGRATRSRRGDPHLDRDGFIVGPSPSHLGGLTGCTSVDLGRAVA